MVVVAAAEVVVFAVGGDVAFDGVVAVQATDIVGPSAEVPAFCSDVAIGEDGEDSQERAEVGAHVEAACGGFDGLAESNVAISRQVAGEILADLMQYPVLFSAAYP